jgi:hypothetical protein
MSSFIAIDITGIDRVKSYLSRFPAVAADAGCDAAADYLVSALKLYPPYSYVTRARAYPDAPAGPGWFSDKQRRYVMMMIHKGLIHPGVKNRTQEFARAWTKVGKGQNVIVANETSYGIFLMDDQRQARMMAIIGWKKIQDTLEERQGKLEQVIVGAVNRALNKFK